MKILFPPGIGDIYWSLVKLQSFLEKKGETKKPDIYIGTRPDEFNSHNRAWPFIEMFPFVNSTREILNVDENPPRFWQEAYTQSETGIFADVLGCDYFMVYNGPINAGVSLDEVDPEYKCNWDLPMTVSLHQKEYTSQCIVQFGEYVVYHFGTRGTYKYWTDEFDVAKIVRAIRKISNRTGTKAILAGGIWDREDKGQSRIAKDANCIDMRGETSLEELYGMIRGAKAVVGFPSGLSILSPALGTKTLSFWSQLYPENTWWNVVPPNTHGKLYYAARTKDLTPGIFADLAEGIINA
jgi:hypothetical protein